MRQIHLNDSNQINKGRNKEKCCYIKSVGRGRIGGGPD